MKQIIKRGLLLLVAVVMMTCQSSILSLAEEEKKTTENTDNKENEEKEQKETEGTKEMVSAPSALLMEVSTGKVLYEKNADEKRPPASVTKIMTLLLVFDALDAGNFAAYKKMRLEGFEEGKINGNR